MPNFWPFLITMLNGGASIREENEIAQDMEDPGNRNCCTVQHWHCAALHCVALTLCSTALCSTDTVQHCTAEYCTAVCTVLYSTALHLMSLNCTTIQSTAIHKAAIYTRSRFILPPQRVCQSFFTHLPYAILWLARLLIKNIHEWHYQYLENSTFWTILPFQLMDER